MMSAKRKSAIAGIGCLVIGIGSLVTLMPARKPSRVVIDYAPPPIKTEIITPAAIRVEPPTETIPITEAQRMQAEIESLRAQLAAAQFESQRVKGDYEAVLKLNQSLNSQIDLRDKQLKQRDDALFNRRQVPTSSDWHFNIPAPPVSTKLNLSMVNSLIDGPPAPPAISGKDDDRGAPSQPSMPTPAVAAQQVAARPGHWEYRGLRGQRPVWVWDQPQQQQQARYSAQSTTTSYYVPAVPVQYSRRSFGSCASGQCGGVF